MTNNFYSVCYASLHSHNNIANQVEFLLPAIFTFQQAYDWWRTQFGLAAQSALVQAGSFSFVM